MTSVNNVMTQKSRLEEMEISWNYAKVVLHIMHLSAAGACAYHKRQGVFKDIYSLHSFWIYSYQYIHSWGGGGKKKFCYKIFTVIRHQFSRKKINLQYLSCLFLLGADKIYMNFSSSGKSGISLSYRRCLKLV